MRQLAHRASAARIHAKGNMLMAGTGQRLEQRHYLGYREIVHAVIAAVFQHIERDALT
jgi:hypothetical protein